MANEGLDPGVKPADFLAHFFQEVSHKKVMVVGDVILDEYVVGEVKRISPEAPVPVVDFLTRSFVCGGAANVAANIAALGGGAIVAGVVGDDEAANHLELAIANAGVCHEDLISDRERPTTVKLRIVAHERQIVRLDREA